MPAPVLLVLHQETSSPGRVGRLLATKGHPLQICRPCLGEPLPASLSGHAGVVVFGGPMSVNDADAFIRREIDWIGVPLREGAPFLGICLGAQMLARRLGAGVAPHSEGLVEAGYYPLRPTAQGRRLTAWPSIVYQWHREGFDLPRGARLLAEGDTFANQAFAYGPAAFGLQFHPELTLAMMHRWTVRGADRLTLPGAQPRAAHLAGRHVHDGETAAWLDGFLDLWLASDTRGARAAAE